MVGGGQLARMSQPAAIGLGITLRVLAERADDCAAQVVPGTMVGAHTDLTALSAFAQGCDVLTFDHEHVPAGHLDVLERSGHTIRPGRAALVHAQDKAVMRERLAAIGVPGPVSRVVRDARDASAFAEEVGWPLVLKTPRGGYDGKGVRVVEDERGTADAFDRATGVLLAEVYVEFTRELAVLVARSPLGQAVAYPVVETVQVDRVCHEVLAPAPALDARTAVAAQHAALSVAHQLGVTGVLAVEMFQTADGFLVNELAMRPHNSGHWTIEGAVTSQFEQHLRAVLDLPLGSPRLVAPAAVMVNVLGGRRADLGTGLGHVLARDPELHVHLYGKVVRPGRKVGHVTLLGDDAGDLRERACEAAAYLQGDSDA
ncbi:MAG: 5-(carboxyamino)imidazole ribonucleotide synthase [Actinomycetota bacterium]|nr:5-(carboxyamino)imidazole ribonucleotide synthase [Actinomycetota bacterium]